MSPKTVMFLKQLLAKNIDMKNKGFYSDKIMGVLRDLGWYFV